MDKERKPEERMNQGPLVPEQVGNLPKTKKKTLIMKMLDAFLVALLLLAIAITVVSMFGHEIFALFKLVAEKEKPEHVQMTIKRDPAPCINGGKPAVPWAIHNGMLAEPPRGIPDYGATTWGD